MNRSIYFQPTLKPSMQNPRQHAVHIIEHCFITLNDGRRLSAKLWLPTTPPSQPSSLLSNTRFPTVLEYLPYRKRDGTRQRDDSTYPVFAAAGIAGVRVDTAGQGDSDGEFHDEYSPQELSDGLEVIQWISEQSWCNGCVGMMGISWGGFNGLQLAALHPPALKAVISLSSTVDRYNDDIHYKNGCQLYSNFSWANVMLMYASRPPDPAIRDDWESLWLQRLQSQPWPMETWLEHQSRDEYWQHGSVCEQFEHYNVPTLIIGGWADLYHNTPTALLHGLQAANNPTVIKAINGPWIHKYPHFAWPKPRMDFHAEAIVWWRHWLLDGNFDVHQWPNYRAFLAEGTRPGGIRKREAGHWVGVSHDVSELRWRHCTLHSNNSLLMDSTEYTESMAHQRSGTNTMTPSSAAADDDEPTHVQLCSPEDCGIACGEIFSLTPDCELSGDQRIDEGGSLLFNSKPLTEPFSILGRPEFQCRVAIDQPLGNLCIRLIDVHPDGMAHRVSWGVLNLSHRYGNANPVVMPVNQFETIKIKLDECGYTFLPGHRIQVALSTAYWPAILPCPYHTTATLELGDSCLFSLPVCTATAPLEIPEPNDEQPLPTYEQLSPSSNRRWVERDLQTQVTRYCVLSDTGETQMPEHGMRVRHVRDEQWSVCTHDPLQAQAQGLHTWYSSRGQWNIKIEASSSMRCDEHHIYLTACVRAWHNNTIFNERSWDKRIKRHFS